MQVFEPTNSLSSLKIFNGVRDLPRLYLIEDEQWERKRFNTAEEFRFSLVLLGNAIVHLERIMQAMEQGMGSSLGVAKGRAKLLGVDIENQQGNYQCLY
ncbi:MAG: hypothetical protein CUN55_20935, partial [Phototrophicales bacterium]